LHRGEVDGARALGFGHFCCCVRWDGSFGEERCWRMRSFGGRSSLQCAFGFGGRMGNILRNLGVQLNRRLNAERYCTLTDDMI
jgi:hypothetical protein